MGLFASEGGNSMQYRYKLGKNGKYEAVAIPAKRVDIVKVNLVKDFFSLEMSFVPPF